MGNEENVDKSVSGLRGVKAFLVVAGSGVMAALIVVGIIYGAIRMISGGFASPVDAASENPSWAPPQELGKGELNLCERTISTLGSVKNRIDSPDSYVDENVDGDDGKRVVSDECSWDINTSKGKMRMDFSYKAVLLSDGESESKRENFAEYKRRLNSVGGSNSKADDSGSLADVGQLNQYFFEESKSEGSSFYFVGGAPSGSYTMKFYPSESSNGPSHISLPEFLEKTRDIAPDVQIDLERWAAY